MRCHASVGAFGFAAYVALVARYDPRTQRRRSLRLQAYDYRQPGAYFLTICSFDRICLFDDSRFRTIVEEVWQHVTTRRRGRRSDMFVVMPNHVHGILWITDNGTVGAQHTGDQKSLLPTDAVRHTNDLQIARRAAPLPPVERARFSVSPGSLGAIARSFKSASARRINEARDAPGSPVWQRNYYERVIRNEVELAYARQYIIDNPRKWPGDPNNTATAAATRALRADG